MFPLSECKISIRTLAQLDFREVGLGDDFCLLLALAIFHGFLAFEIFQADGVQVELLLLVAGTENQTGQAIKFPRTFGDGYVFRVPSIPSSALEVSLGE